jgi:hypothetical protein
MVTLAQVEQWCNDPVTKAIRQGVIEIVRRGREAVGENAGNDKDFDLKQQGYFRGCLDSWDLEALKEQAREAQKNED